MAKKEFILISNNLGAFDDEFDSVLISANTEKILYTELNKKGYAMLVSDGSGDAEVDIIYQINTEEEVILGKSNKPIIKPIINLKSLTVKVKNNHTSLSKKMSNISLSGLKE